MSVSNTVVTKLSSAPLQLAEQMPGISPGTGGVWVSPGDVEPTPGLFPVDDFPPPGISPANAVAERTHASVTATNSRFIDCLLLSEGPCKSSYMKISKQERFLQRTEGETIIATAFSSHS